MSNVAQSVFVLNKGILTKKRKDLEGVLNQYKKIKENEKKAKKDKKKLEKELIEKDEIIKQKEEELKICEEKAEEEYKKKNN